MRCSLIARCLDGVVVVCEATAAIFSGCPHVLYSGKIFYRCVTKVPEGNTPTTKGNIVQRVQGDALRCFMKVRSGEATMPAYDTRSKLVWQQ